MSSVNECVAVLAVCEAPQGQPCVHCHADLNDCSVSLP